MVTGFEPNPEQQRQGFVLAEAMGRRDAMNARFALSADDAIALGKMLIEHGTYAKGPLTEALDNRLETT